jgi:hypothetical protein
MIYNIKTYARANESAEPTNLSSLSSVEYKKSGLVHIIKVISANYVSGVFSRRFFIFFLTPQIVARAISIVI